MALKICVYIYYVTAITLAIIYKTEKLFTMANLILVFVPSMTFATYLLSNLFSKHETALKMSPSLLQMTSMFLVMPIQIMMFFPDARSSAQTLHAVFSFIFPNYALIGAIVMMQYQYVMVEMGAEDSKSYFDNSDVRVTFLAFVVQIIVYPALLVCIDRCKHSSRGLAASDSIPESDAVTDIDVLAEHEAAKAGVAADGEPLAIRTIKMHKAFAGSAKQAPNIAVHNLSLAVRPRECLGLLGPNGAGKTTSIR